MKRVIPEQGYLLECFRYDRESGLLHWLIRPAHHFGGELRNGTAVAKTVNGRFAGVVATGAVSRGYKRICIDGTIYAYHRVVWKLVNGTEPDSIDHINGDRSDNRICNLRSVTCSDNSKNMKRPRNNTSGVIGVHWSNSKQKWVAQIKVGGKLTMLGRFSSLDDAAAARRAAEMKHGFHRNHGRAAQCAPIQRHPQC